MKELTARQDSLAELIRQKQTSCRDKRERLSSLQTQLEEAEEIKREVSSSELEVSLHLNHLLLPCREQPVSYSLSRR